MRASSRVQLAAMVLDGAIAQSRAEADPDAALRHFTDAAVHAWGDPGIPTCASEKPEHRTSCGVFLLAPSRRYLVLFCGSGYAVESRYLRVSIHSDLLGYTLRTGRATWVPGRRYHWSVGWLLGADRTDASLHSPMRWGNEVVGVFRTSTSAPLSYGAEDLVVHNAFAIAAAVAWREKGRAELIQRADQQRGPWAGESFDQPFGVFPLG